MKESEIREHVFTAYKQGMAKSYGDVRTYVSTRKPPPHELNSLEEDGFRRVMWDLALQGVVSPQGVPAAVLLNTARLTEYGRQCVAQAALLPHDIDGYLENLKTCMGAASDELILQYAKEALECYHRNNLRAAVVVLGVAAERSLEILKSAYVKRLGEEERAKAAPKLNARHLRDRFSYLWKRLETMNLPGSLQDRLEADFWGAFQLVRRSRNDAGHFTAVETDKLTALACLASFPNYVRTVFALAAHVRGERTE